jgi:hypothetical protein
MKSTPLMEGNYGSSQSAIMANTRSPHNPIHIFSKIISYNPQNKKLSLKRRKNGFYNQPLALLIARYFLVDRIMAYKGAEQ